jgi:2,4-dienoyl-CoA reductase-like NADH-dependent reductase (Old Yellow Enzyme family)
VWIANEKLTPASAKQILETEQADAVAFGLAYIANPDLLERLEHDLPLNQVQFDTYMVQVQKVIPIILPLNS